MISIPSWALKWIKSSCWNQIEFYNRPRAFCQRQHCLLPRPHPTSPSLLPHNPTSNKWRKKKEKNGFQQAAQSFFSLLTQQVPPFTNLLGPWTLYSPNSLLKSIFSSSPTPFPTCLCTLQYESPWLKLQAQYEWNMRWHKSEMGKALRCVPRKKSTELLIVATLWSSTGWGGVRVGTNWVLILFIKPTMAGARNSIKGNELVPF